VLEKSWNIESQSKTVEGESLQTNPSTEVALTGPIDHEVAEDSTTF
jgi:hypothetical protein